MPSGNQPGPAHDLVGVPAEEVSGIVRRAKDEFLFMATAGYPLWILSSTDNNAYHPETLNYLEYLRMSQRGGVPPYFQSEASRHSATIRVSPITIVQTLMDVDQWLHIWVRNMTSSLGISVILESIDDNLILYNKLFIPFHQLFISTYQFDNQLLIRLDDWSFVLRDPLVDLLHW